MEKTPNPYSNHTPEQHLGEKRRLLPPISRTIDEVGTAEFILNGERYISYPPDLIADSTYSPSMIGVLPVLELDSASDNEFVFKLPNSCITLMSAAVENLQAEEDRAMALVWSKLGDLLHDLPDYLLPSRLSMKQVIINQENGTLQLLPSVNFSGGSSVQKLVKQLEAEYASAMFDPEQRSKLKTLTANLIRHATRE